MSSPFEMREPTPRIQYQSTRQYYDAHKLATIHEFNHESNSIREANRRGIYLDAWLIEAPPKGRPALGFTFRLRVDNGQRFASMLPKLGKHCYMSIGSDAAFYNAERTEDRVPLSSQWNQFPEFKVTGISEDCRGLKPPLLSSYASKSENVEPDPRYAIRVKITLRLSTTTFSAEIGALESIARGTSLRQREVLNMLALPPTMETFPYVNLFDKYPYMDPCGADEQQNRLVHWALRELDTDQWTAYMRLKSIPRGVCIVPGGAGAGKTRWSLLVAAMAQMRRPTKVLYLIDINKPLDDTASKMMRIYKDLGMKKNVIRMLKWPRELEKNGIEQKIREVEAQNKETEAGSEKSTKGVDPSEAEFRASFLEVWERSHGANKEKHEDEKHEDEKHEDEFRPPTLDEAACRHYMANKHTGKYSGVGYFLGIREIVAHDPVLRFSQGPENFSYAMKNLYRDVLGEADFIATTPVAAFCHFDGMFKPDLVFLDECGHARELSTLIPIAFFDPAAWFFVGDYRQTSPYVGCRDEECDPLHMSMMERIAKSGPTPLIRTQLLTNHRAWGDLQRLASQLFYGGRMRSDRPDGENFPASLRNLHEYFESFRTEQDFQAERSRVPRFVVHAGGREEEVCRSFWNPTHHQWVMNCVMQLLHAPWFLQTDGSAKGTILIVSPYREGADKYKAAVEAIEPPEMRERVQARTVGTVQGAEADVVFVDMAKQRASPHTNDPKRLCVALTRAKQAEIIMMSERMVEQRWNGNNDNLVAIWKGCKSGEHGTVLMRPRAHLPPTVEEQEPEEGVVGQHLEGDTAI